MSIKFRLLLSYITLLLVPIIATTIIGIFAGTYYIGDIYKNYPGIAKLTRTHPFLHRDILLSDIKQVSLTSPEEFENKDNIKRWEDKLTGFNSGMIVRKNDEIIYVSPILHELGMESHLPRFGEYISDIAVNEEGKNTELVLSQHDFYFTDRSQGSIFLVTNIEPVKKNFQELINVMTITGVVIIAATNGTLTYLVAGSIIKPLNKLKDSANRIKKGDLDFEIQTETKDEIGDLSHAFEEMRKRLKNSLDTQIQYEENRKELFASISHDLKTPITTIKGYVEGIRDGVADTPEKMERYINTIHKKTVDVDRLIDDLFLFSKLDLNKLPLHLTIIDISKHFTYLVEELSFDLEKKNIIIRYYDKTNEDILLVADVIQLKRVVVNIIENAVKYMDKSQGIIDILLEKQGDEVKVEIRDNGSGITQESLPFIFDRFYRGDSSRNSATGGSGLGLAIAKKIIEEHGGTMWAESVEGLGTSIFFKLKNHKRGDLA